MDDAMACGVYIMTNESQSTLYVGMSINLAQRVDVHRHGLVQGFALKYRCTKLVYYEACPNVDSAYLREKQIKGWTRLKKVGLINYFNPKWRDLFEDLITESI
jgi:putative endonuclease